MSQKVDLSLGNPASHAGRGSSCLLIAIASSSGGKSQGWAQAASRSNEVCEVVLPRDLKHQARDALIAGFRIAAGTGGISGSRGTGTGYRRGV